MASPERIRRRDARWRTAAELLDLVRQEPGITRAAAAQRLRLSSGSATDIATRLRELALLAEQPAPISGRGRPTTLLKAHPRGPVALAVDLRYADWRTAVAGLDGIVETSPARRHDDADPGHVLSEIRTAIAAARRRFRHRLRIVSV